MTLETGKVYVMNHSRKGELKVKVLKDEGEWVTVEILQGKVAYASVSNNLAQRIYGLGTHGDTITVRKSLATFKELVKPLD